jgi:DNA-binding CsgD family transcriptional regulator/PAS domain-containing protein
MKQSELDRFIIDAHNCPGDISAWLRLAQNIATAERAEHAHLAVFRPDGGLAADVTTDPNSGELYRNDYVFRDLGAARVLTQPPGQLIWSQTLLTPQELAQCAVQNELLPQLSTASRSWIHAPSADGLCFGLALLHGRSYRGPEQRQVRRLQTLHTHLQQSMSLHLILDAAHRARLTLEAGLEALAAGFLLLDSKGRVQFANRSARQFFAAGRLRLKNGQLAGATAAEDAAIRRLIAGALSRTTPVPGTIRLADCRVQAVPGGTPGAVMPEPAACVLLLHDVGPPPVDAGALKSFGLTAAEARLAVALAQGETVEDYAGRTGRSMATVRSQLRSVFSKTGTHRQSELLLFVQRAS